MKNFAITLMISCLTMAISQFDSTSIARAQPADRSSESPTQIGNLRDKRRVVQQEMNKLLRDATGPDEARPILRELVRQEFEVLQAIQRIELDLMRKRLAVIEQKIEQQQTSADAIIDHRVEMIMDGSHADLTSPASAAASKPGIYRIAPGDTLGVYIPEVLGERDTPPVFHVPGSGRPPAIGYPLTVRHDGSIKIPLLDAFQVAGLTLPEAEKQMANAFVEKSILRESAFVSLTLLAGAGEATNKTAAEIQSGGNRNSAPGDKTELPGPGRLGPGKRQSASDIAENEIIVPGDTLGVYIPGVLGSSDEPPPTFTIGRSNLPPVIGYPIPVRSDGTISLPLIGKYTVAGLNIASLEDVIRSAYIDDEILSANTVIIVQLVPRIDD